MTYTLTIRGWGNECLLGEMSDEIWKFIQEECNGETDTYLDKLDNDEVPEDLKLSDGGYSMFDNDYFFKEYGANPYACVVNVVDEDGNEVFSCEDCSGIDVERSLESVDENISHYYLYSSDEKGHFVECKFDADKFDASKLTIKTNGICFNNDDDNWNFIVGVEYDGEELEFSNELDTRGVSFTFRVY